MYHECHSTFDRFLPGGHDVAHNLMLRQLHFQIGRYPPQKLAADNYGSNVLRVDLQGCTAVKVGILCSAPPKYESWGKCT
jgi:hypothetical protein